MIERGGNESRIAVCQAHTPPRARRCSSPSETYVDVEGMGSKSTSCWNERLSSTEPILGPCLPGP